jgi:hypothetical protein
LSGDELVKAFEKYKIKIKNENQIENIIKEVSLNGN